MRAKYFCCRGSYLPTYLPTYTHSPKRAPTQDMMMGLTFFLKRWTSLDKEESLACQIASPFNNKLGCFLINYKDCITKQPIFLLNWEVIRRASDSSLSKELNEKSLCLLPDQGKENFLSWMLSIKLYLCLRVITEMPHVRQKYLQRSILALRSLR